MAKKVTKTATRKASPIKRGDQAPEAKATKPEKAEAADKMFKDADEASRAGLPVDMTHEQRANQVRRAALGY